MGTDLYTGLPSNTWLIVFVVLWLIVMAGVVAVVADRHGRNGGAWFLVSLLVTPVVALALLIMDTKPDRTPVLAGPRPEAGAKPRGTPPGTRPCPKCDAPVLRSRKTCPACGVRLIAGAAAVLPLVFMLMLAGCSGGVTMGTGTIKIRTWPVAEPLTGELPVGRWLCLPDAKMAEMRDSNKALFPSPCNVVRFERSHAAEFYPDGTGWTLRIYERTNR